MPILLQESDPTLGLFIYISKPCFMFSAVLLEFSIFYVWKEHLNYIKLVSYNKLYKSMIKFNSKTRLIGFLASKLNIRIWKTLKWIIYVSKYVVLKMTIPTSNKYFDQKIRWPNNSNKKFKDFDHNSGGQP